MKGSKGPVDSIYAENAENLKFDIIDTLRLCQ